jgi:acyl dehydratase
VIPYGDLLKVRSPDRTYGWTDRDAMLYALAIGLGSQPLDERELPFVYEKNLRVVPSFATVAAWGSNPPLERMEVNYAMVVHGEQGVTLHRPMPPSAQVTAFGRVTGAVDKGPRGAVIFTETVLRNKEDDAPLATLTSTLVARGDGGFGGPGEGGPVPHACPDRPAEATLEFRTRSDQALLYRLLGDRNPLHVDPPAARAAGFERPILHGLCTFGITCRAVLQSYGAYRPERIASHRVRFAAPVFPGETIAVDLWRDDDVVSFAARVKDRGVEVVKNGKTVLR